MELLALRIASAVAIAAAYMLFDIFNKRNVPGVFAYATLIYGAVLTALYLEVVPVLTSAAIALIILGIGYLIYRAGQVGAADVIEFAALSLIIPMQPVPIVAKQMLQFGMPFAVSVIVGTGIAAMVLVPLYYLPKARLTKRSMSVSRTQIVKALAIAAAYLFFVFSLEKTAGITVDGAIILVILLLGSATITAFEEPITRSMVKYVPASQFDEGDIIAFNLMSKKEISAVKRRARRFDRLLTHELIREMRAKRIRQRFPVYKEALPLALPIFVGVVMSLLVGDLFIFILPVL